MGVDEVHRPVAQHYGGCHNFALGRRAQQLPEATMQKVALLGWETPKRSSSFERLLEDRGRAQRHDDGFDHFGRNVTRLALPTERHITLDDEHKRTVVQLVQVRDDRVWAFFIFRRGSPIYCSIKGFVDTKIVLPECLK